MQTNLDFSGKVVLIVGSRGDLGDAVVRVFLSYGATVIAHTRDKGETKEILERLKAFGQRIDGISADIADQNEVHRMLQYIETNHGRLDVLVNNETLVMGRNVDPADEQAWDRVLRTNVWGTFYVTSLAIKLMQKSGGGAVVTTLSTVPGYSNGGVYWYHPAFLASKGALYFLTRKLACDFTRAGIRVNAVIPAPILTEKILSASAQPVGGGLTIGDYISRKWFCSAEEIANVYLFLASDMASFISGEVVACGSSRKINLPI